MATDSKTIKAILFDLDGVLIDSPDWHFEALNRALGLFGMGITRDDHIARFNGLPTVAKLEMLGVKPALWSIIADLKQQYTRELIDKNCRPDYQKIMLLRDLAQKYHLACVSNATKASIQKMLEQAELYEYFTILIGNADVKHHKPAPDGYLLAMETMKVTPDECVIVEDAPPGIAAARATGARVLTVPGYNFVHSGLFVIEGLL